MDQEIELENELVIQNQQASQASLEDFGKPHLVVNNGITIFRNDSSRAEIIVKEWRDSYGKI